MRIPGPTDLAHLVDWIGSSVETVSGLIPRVVQIVDAAEELVERMHQLADRAELTIGAVDRAVGRANGVLTAADETTRRAAVVVDGAAVVVEAAAETTGHAGNTVANAAETLSNASNMLDAVEPPLTRLRPSLEVLAETTDPDEVAAVVKMVDMLPEMTESVRSDVLPMLKTLDSVGPDLRELLLVSRELNEMLGSLPGMGRIKKRVEEEQAEEADSRPQPNDG